MMRTVLFTLLIFIGGLSCKQNSKGGEYETNPNEITWLDIAAADDLQNGEGKGYFIDVYTEWCGWCKVMDRNTFTNPEVIKVMNEKFHNIKFDAEMREQISFDGKDYQWQAGGRNGVNTLALDLLKGDLSFPSYVILDANKKPINIYKGYMEAESFLQLIR